MKKVKSKAMKNIMRKRQYRFWTKIANAFVALAIATTLVISFLLGTLVNTKGSIIAQPQAEAIFAEDYFELHYNLGKNIYEAYTMQIDFVNKYKSIDPNSVCSELNRSFNDLAKVYVEYTLLVDDIESSYNVCLKQCKAFNSNISPEVYKEDIEYFRKSQEKIDFLYNKAKDLADTVFYEYYDIMVKLVNGEAGASWCTAEDHYLIANLVENRILFEGDFGNNVHDVIFERGQFACTWDGNFNKTPTEQVKADVRNYLRGYVETGMPRNVVFQAKFRQGTGTWKYMPSSKHYFCFA